MPTLVRTLWLFIIAVSASAAAHGETVAVAVASNFAEPLRAIAATFTQQSGHEVRISTGSTGHLYAQIVNGAPYDVFLAADAERPERLAADATGIADSRFTYAIGTLVLWVRKDLNPVLDCETAFDNVGKGKIAIANPLLAPYGVAAKQVLQAQGAWESLQSNLVYGENISQVLHFVVTGNVDLALLSASQLAALRDVPTQCIDETISADHEPIAQQAIQLTRTSTSEPAQAFMAFLRGPEARDIIASFAYQLPAEHSEATR